ncbi:MAG: hypothetical protein AAFU74_07745, partial [Bacteroidota bacterium]
MTELLALQSVGVSGSFLFKILFLFQLRKKRHSERSDIFYLWGLNSKLHTMKRLLLMLSFVGLATSLQAQTAE